MMVEWYVGEVVDSLSLVLVYDSILLLVRTINAILAKRTARGERKEYSIAEKR